MILDLWGKQDYRFGGGERGLGGVTGGMIILTFAAKYVNRLVKNLKMAPKTSDIRKLMQLKSVFDSSSATAYLWFRYSKILEKSRA